MAIEINMGSGRDRKKAESLANEIFGKGRRTSSPLHASGRTKSGVVHNLASRISKVRKMQSVII